MHSPGALRTGLVVTALLASLLQPSPCAANVMTSSCSAHDRKCEFKWSVSHWSTMMYNPQRPGEEQKDHCHPVIFLRDGTAVYRQLSQTVCNDSRPLGKKELRTVVTGDGETKMMMMINRQHPGPSIVVYEGQEVVVRITNDLVNEAFTMHWHGIRQRNTPWMDGGGSVSQCAILPGETFTYRFVADPVGTHWYHPHVGTQRSQGAFGAIIVLPRTEKKAKEMRGDDPLPMFSREFVMTIQDLFQQESYTLAYQWGYGIGGFSQFSDLNQCRLVTHNVDGFENAYIPFHSALINGKGRHYPFNSTTPDNPGVPLEVFHVTNGGKYRFRVINAALAMSFVISIDLHKLHVIAADGHDVKSTPFDSVVVGPGERFDFWIVATDPSGSENYWIRADTLEWTYGEKRERIIAGHTEAILHYETRPNGDPSGVSVRRHCTINDPCHVLNCPFRYYPKSENTLCIPVTDLRQPTPMATWSARDNPFLEYFYNFRYAGVDTPKNVFRATINGRQFRAPSAPPQTYPRGRFIEKVCTAKDCDADSCHCTHIVPLPLHHIIQFVLFVRDDKMYTATTHPVHIHAYHFQVVKIGWPEYDTRTGQYKSLNSDIRCLVNSHCNSATWSDPSWRNGNVPGIVQDSPVRKDTVLVPVGGYVVIRFMTENPGFWFMHCHMESHNENGMALVIQEGNVTDMNRLPVGFKTCGSFDWSEEEFLTLSQKPSGRQ
ncbi:hypothetical protein NP493_88g01019 [Ridgeia piscesae]|uniref:Uncharacterized protein n=1 Tax=Ridgeia piscesae TaxID=27915 RepID=A0AAD9UI57_RIDPI|nr:hypothetical protein NP493_88g01019 [Ridgeia piscesae]